MGIEVQVFAFGLWTALLAVVGAAMAALLPPVSRELAARKQKAVESWWNECAEGYAAFKAEAGREPDAKRRGSDEAAWGRWRDDVRRVAGMGQLSPARAVRAVELGVLAEEAVDAATAKWPGEMPEPEGGAACICFGGIAGALAFACGAAGGMEGARLGIYATLALICMAASAVAWQVDVAWRIIPWECAAAAAACGIAGQLTLGGIAQLCWAAAMALVTAAAFKLACFAEKMLRGGTAVGAGDVRFAAAAALACGPDGLLAGLAAGAVAYAATWASEKRKAGVKARDTRRMMMPMGPALAAMAAIGMAAAPAASALL